MPGCCIGPGQWCSSRTRVPEGLVQNPRRWGKIGPLAFCNTLQRGAGKRGACGTWFVGRSLRGKSSWVSLGCSALANFTTMSARQDGHLPLLAYSPTPTDCVAGGCPAWLLGGRGFLPGSRTSRASPPPVISRLKARGLPVFRCVFPYSSGPRTPPACCSSPHASLWDVRAHDVDARGGGGERRDVGGERGAFPPRCYLEQLCPPVSVGFVC